MATQPVPTADPQSANKTNALADFYDPNFTEQTQFRSAFDQNSFRPPYNRDELWQKYGSYKAYETMLQDDQVSVCLQLKKDLVLGGGGSFEPGDDNQDDIIEDLNKAFFEDYEGDFEEDLEAILTSYEFGFSLTEKVFKIRDAGRLGLKYLRTRHPNTWRLYQDDKGNVTKFEQITVAGDLDVNSKSLTHVINQGRFQNPFGYSDLRQAYAAWFAKREIVKYSAIFMEKAASPIPIGKFNKNAPQSAVDKLFAILKGFQTKTAMAIPEDVNVEFLEAKNNGDVYVKMIDLFNLFIGRSLFIPDLVGFAGAKTSGGSHALGSEQMDLFFKHISRRRKQLENIINKEFVFPIVTYNHGLVPDYPKFKFKPLDDKQASELAKVWLDAVKGKTYIPNPEEINHFRKIVKFPEGPVLDKMPDQVNPLTGEITPGEHMDRMQTDPKDGSKPMDGQSNPSKKDTAENAKPNGKGGNPNIKNKLADKSAQKFGKVYNLPPGDYYKKVDFKAIKNKLEDYDASIMNEFAPLVTEIIDDLISQIKTKKILQTGNIDKLESLSIRNKANLKTVLKKSFTQLYNDAQVQASSEILKSNFAKPKTSQKFLDTIESESYQFIGDYEYSITKRVKQEIIAAVKDGKSLNSIEGVLTDDLQQLSDVQLERFARTKHTEVLNNGRQDFFESSGVVAGYQYSAILDDVTSDICAGLDGKIFTAGDEPVPPMHFNCRSTLVPITKYEEFTPTERIRGLSVDDFIEENKGKGFPTK